MIKRIAIVPAVLALSVSGIASAAPVVFEASGATPADIQATVEDFRVLLGPLNANVARSFPDGRREINWDGVPDTIAAPRTMPPFFFNFNSPRGAVFFTPGTGFQISADDSNSTGTPILFGNLDPAFQRQFVPFSPQRLFTPLGSNLTETLFFVPGSETGATVGAFGAVFTDVDRSGSTKIECFDQIGLLLFSRSVLPGPGGHASLSFLGVAFDAGERIFLVRITSGDRALTAPARVPARFAAVRTPGTPAPDLVAMDDFIFAEPQALP